MHRHRRIEHHWHDDEEDLTLTIPRRFAVRADSSALADSLLGLRALQAFDNSAARYPIHRELRFAARLTLEELFDRLALHAAPRAQRLTVGSLVLEDNGLFATVSGRFKREYSSGNAKVWAADLATLCAFEARIADIVGEQHVREEMFTVDWHFHGGSMGLTSVSFEELADPDLLDEAYPTLGMPVAAFIAKYLQANETVLILQGPPGTGKTRLVRAILAAMSRVKKDSAQVLYTADKRALENDELYVSFLTDNHDAFVVEDADHLLGSRANGNIDLHRFLTVADGVVRAQGRKIIFTTNLPNIGDIDPALIRPGRCFRVVFARALTSLEIEALIDKSVHEIATHKIAITERLFGAGQKSATLAAFYRTAAAVFKD